MKSINEKHLLYFQKNHKRNRGGTNALATLKGLALSVTLGLLLAASFTNGVVFAGEVKDNYGQTVIATGSGNSAPTATGDRSIAIGDSATSDGNRSVAIGYGAKSNGNWSLALGQNSESSKDNSVALGNTSKAEGAYSLAFGANSKAESMFAVALGKETNVAANYGLALGAEAVVTTNAFSSVAIGYDSNATERYTVSFGNDSTKRRLVNVAAGTAATDAVNVGQLNTAVANEKTERIAAINAEATAREQADNALGQEIDGEKAERKQADARLEQRVDDMERGIDGRFDKLDSKIDKVGAGAAALAALHPLDYDPDDKLNFAVGLGSYRSEQAAALGAFYRPDETVMFSVGGTMGNNDNMVNLGVSFALDGRRAKAKESRAKLEAKLENMSGELAEVKAQLALLMQQTQEKK